MKLIDRSPSLFLALAFVVVYGVIGIEVAMWMIATPLAVFGTLALIAVVAALIARSFEELVAPTETTDAAVALVAQDEAARPAPRPAHRVAAV